jgi:hypothetical protein
MSSGRRDKIIKELLSTEETYVNSLTWLIENFQAPILQGGIITPAQDDLIFLNSASILELHKPLLEKLKTIVKLTGETGMDQVCIGNIMLDLVPWLRLYTTYINGHQEGAVLIDQLVKSVGRFTKSTTHCFCHKLRINNLRFLLNPFRMIISDTH